MEITLELLQSPKFSGPMAQHMGVKITSIENKRAVAQLTVDERHLRPGNIMNGGISLMLIETVGSISSMLHINVTSQNAFGLQVNANHVAVAYPGDVLTVTADSVHLGRTTHIWDVNIFNQNNKLVSSGRITMLVTDRK